NGGATTHPKWFRNLERDPNVTVEVGAERFPATARILDGAERDAVFAAIVARAPAAGAFQEKAGRTIPVIELVRLMGSADRVSAGIAEGVTKSKSFCSAVGRVLSADNSWPSGVARGRSPW